MPQYRADYDIKTNLVLARDTAPLILRGNDPRCEVTLKNAPDDDEGHIPGLIGIVVADADTMDAVHQNFRRFLAAKLDVLSLSTCGHYMILDCRRVVEWEPGQRSRAARPMRRFDSTYPPDPMLGGRLLATIDEVSKAVLPTYVAQAMRSFRLGVIEAQVEEQFAHFWRALETVAEGSKEGVRVPIPCPKCSGPLFCEKCGTHPQRRPMARQAIRELIGRIVTRDPDAAYKELAAARDHLAHGRPSETLAAKVGRDLHQLVNGIAQVSRQAILMHLSPELRAMPFGHRGNDFVIKDLIASPLITFDHDGAGDHPPDDKIPAVNISMQVRLGSQVSGQ